MDIDLFEKITNAIAVLIKNDAIISAYCTEKLGSTMKPIDNSIDQVGFQDVLPYFVITKGEEEHFFNKGTSAGTKSIFPCTIIFFGDFAADQVDDANFTLPVGAKTTVNLIETFTPSDVMRKIARIAGSVINDKIECSIPQLRMESFNVFSEGYYDTESGLVGSILGLNLYQSSTAYSN